MGGQQKRDNFGTFRRLLIFLQPHWKSVALGLSALIATSLLELVPPLAIKYITDRIIQGSAEFTRPERLKLLFLSGLGLAALHLLIAVFNRVRSITMHILGERFILDLRRRLYSHLQKLSLTFYETRQTGEIMSRVTNDSEVVEQFVTHAADTLIADVLRVIVIAVILFNLNASLAIVGLIPVPILGIITYKYSKKVRSLYRSTRERLADINAKLQDNLSGIRVIKSLLRKTMSMSGFPKKPKITLTCGSMS